MPRPRAGPRLVNLPAPPAELETVPPPLPQLFSALDAPLPDATEPDSTLMDNYRCFQVEIDADLVQLAVVTYVDAGSQAIATAQIDFGPLARMYRRVDQGRH